MHLSGEVSPGSINSLVSRIDTAIDFYYYSEIELVIASPGGSVTALFQYIDALRRWKKDRVKLRTRVLMDLEGVGVGAASAAAVMLSLGDDRYVDRHVTLLYHHGRYSQVNDLTSMDAIRRSRELDHIDALMTQRLVERALEVHSLQKQLRKKEMGLLAKKKDGIEKEIEEKIEGEIEKIRKARISYEWWDNKNEGNNGTWWDEYWSHRGMEEDEILKFLLGKNSDREDSEETEEDPKDGSKKQSDKDRIKDQFMELNRKVIEALESSDGEGFKKLYKRFAERDFRISPYIAFILRLIDHIDIGSALHAEEVLDPHALIQDEDDTEIVSEKENKEGFPPIKEWHRLYPLEGRISLEYLKRHTLVLGETGSGKTVSGILPVLNAIFTSKPEHVGAALVIDPKREIEAKLKLESDENQCYRKFEPSKSRLNLMEFEWDLKEHLQRGEWETAGQKIVKRAATLDRNSPAKVLLGEEASSDNSSFFSTEGSELVASIVALILMLIAPNAPTRHPECKGWSGESDDPKTKWAEELIAKSEEGTNIFDLVKWALSSELVELKFSDNGNRVYDPLFVEFAKVRRELGMLGSEGEDLLRKFSGPLNEAMESRQQTSGTKRTANQVISPFVDGDVKDCLFFGCEPGYLKPELNPERLMIDFKSDVAVDGPDEHGTWRPEKRHRSVVLYQPARGKSSRLIATALKALFFETVLEDGNRKKPHLEGKLPLVAYVADEFHRFATSDETHGEQSYLDSCRSYDAFCVLASQSTASIRHAFSVGSRNDSRDTESLNILLANTGTKLFFRTTEDGTRERLENLSPSYEGLQSVVKVRPPSTLLPGECYAVLPDGRFERRQLEPFRLRNEHVEAERAEEKSDAGDLTLHELIHEADEAEPAKSENQVVEQMKELLKNESTNAKLDEVDAFGCTALDLAAMRGKSKIACMLVDKGAEANTPQVPLAWAVHHDDVNTVERLRLRGNVKWEAGHEGSIIGGKSINELAKSEKMRAELKKWQGIGLHEAARMGREADVRKELEAGADPNASAGNGRAPLHEAAREGREKIVTVLLEHDADPDAKDGDGMTPLHWAVKNNRTPVLDALLAAEANPNTKDDEGLTPLHYAAWEGRERLVEKLSKAGARLEEKHGEGWTPLCVAAREGHETVVTALLECQADPNAQDDGSMTPLHWAAVNGHEVIVKVLLEADAVPNAKANSGGTPLFEAAHNGHEAIVKVLLEADADPNAKVNSGGTPLFEAAHNGHEAIVKVLLEADADPNAKANSGLTPLFGAAHNGHEAIIKVLLEADADPKAKADDGTTPLHFTAASGHVEIAKLLLSYGANLDAEENDGSTPLHSAAGNGRVEIVKLFLERGANLSAEGHNGWTPLHVAVAQGHVEIVNLFLKQGAELNAIDAEGSAPLHWAAGHGHEAAVRLLLEHGGAEPNAQNNNGATPLHLAVSNGHEAAVRLLLEHGGVEPNVRHSEFGLTPLHLAALLDHEATVRLLLKHEAEPNAKDNEGRTALDLAEASGHDAIVELLRALSGS